MSGEHGAAEHVVLQRVVLPVGIELPGLVDDVLALYVNRAGLVREGQHPQRHHWKRSGSHPHPDEPLDPAPAAPDAHPTGRTSLLIAPFGRVSFDTYFNRVHAGYLARWTGLEELTLRIRGTGTVQVVVRRCTREGRPAVHRVATVDLDAEVPYTCSVPVRLFRGGGAVWFDLQAMAGEVALHSAEWVALVPERRRSVVDVGVCTFNRPHDVLTLLRTLGADDEFRSHLGTVWVIDHGSRGVLDLPEAVDEVARWGDQLRVVHQPNLGGSGGFSRAMFEAVSDGRADYLVLSDDDALAEPESLRRAVVFADVATVPVAVGGQMLLRAHPTELHSSGERINPATFRWGLAPLGQEEIRVDRVPLDRVVDVGYNGWWLCLLPIEAIRQVGLALPYFIKWDDAEYGYRLREAGVPTVTLPGVATWHESWELKDDTTDWTLYFHIRNRLMTAAMLSADMAPEVARGRLRAVLTEVLRQDVLRNISRRAYSSVDAANQALEDFLVGPSVLQRPLDEMLGEVRANRARFPGDAQVEAFSPDTRAPGDPARLGKRSLAFPRALAREFGWPPARPARPPAGPQGGGGDLPTESDEWDLWGGPVDRGPVLMPKSADFWWGLAGHDDAAVVSVDGSTAFRRGRDPQAARALVGRFWSLARRVLQEGPQLVAPYEQARRTLTRPEEWEKQWSR
jgi:galactofuranosylgalactofuranosylrhamnosyl-N-acetylglucosaminyl-diphospho-decaprenol beta-1,5/1,6-galactofuranosyltransferase